LEPIVDKYNLLRGGCSDSRISSLWSTGDGMDRDGGSGGSGGGGNAAVTASMRAWVDVILSVWIWVRHPDDGGKGGECAGGAVHGIKYTLASSL
ncbi:hypothetical protein Tco_0440850, partial [Tanacetum coccineum]